jgi:O-antigen/teichoic acid export membrane protein
MIGRADLVLKNSVIALVLNVLLNVALIPPYGMVGAGLAWGISIVIWNLIRLWQVYRVLGMQPFGDWSRPVGLSLSVFVLTAAALRVLLGSEPAALAIIGGAAGATLAYAMALLATSSFDDEDNLILGRFARIGRASGRTRPSS